MRICGMLVLWCLWSDSASADGGLIRLSEVRNGLRISVFTAPTPPRVGQVEISILVQEAKSGKPLLGQTIRVEAAPKNHPNRKVHQQAAGEITGNRLMQAALLVISQPGPWLIDVAIQDKSVHFEMDVAEPMPAWIDWIAWIGWPFLVVAFFAWRQWRGYRLNVSKH